MSSGIGSAVLFVTSLSAVSQILIVAIVALWILFNLRFTPRVADLGPTILTTIGIFGTFLGVAIGLSHFDTANVQASVPALLAGLKTAFWASVFGVGAAVQIKAREFLFGARAADDDGEEEASAASIHTVLVEIRDSIGGSSESALVQQTRLLRQDLNDRLVSQVRAARQDANERLESLRNGQGEMIAQMQALCTAQADALHQLAGMGAQTLVDALQGVVTSFNDKVAGQFGENYRDLNQAVGQLLSWQTGYRDTIKTMTDQLADTLRLLGYAAGDFRAVTQGSERFAQTAERVGRVLDGIEAGETRVATLVQGLCRLTEEASGRVPYIESRLYELTTQMTGAVQANQATLHAALSETAAMLRDIVAATQIQITEAAAQGAAQMQVQQCAIAGALHETTAAVAGALQATQASLAAAVDGFDAQTGALADRARARVAQLDQASAAAITQAIERLAAQIGAQIDEAGTRIALRAPAHRPLLREVAQIAGED